MGNSNDTKNWKESYKDFLLAALHIKNETGYNYFYVSDLAEVVDEPFKRSKEVANMLREDGFFGYVADLGENTYLSLENKGIKCAEELKAGGVIDPWLSQGQSQSTITNYGNLIQGISLKQGNMQVQAGSNNTARIEQINTYRDDILTVLTMTRQLVQEHLEGENLELAIETVEELEQDVEQGIPRPRTFPQKFAWVWRLIQVLPGAKAIYDFVIENPHLIQYFGEVSIPH